MNKINFQLVGKIKREEATNKNQITTTTAQIMLTPMPKVKVLFRENQCRAEYWSQSKVESA
jgi:hypothetical protein